MIACEQIGATATFFGL